MREATLAEIKENARRQLAEQGPGGVSLRAIARGMGMTAPGLYRYFSSIGDLLNALKADLFTELAEAVEGASSALPPEDTDGRILTSLRAFRTWALANRPEFALMFGLPGPDRSADARVLEAARHFAATFFALFDRLLEERRFALPAEEDIPPALRAQLDAFATETGFTTENVSYGALRVLLSSWVRLYGVVCMEVFDHLSLILGDMEPLFEAELQEVLTPLGVAYRAPGGG
ncbi:TetR/AcrR family transcriptional regulator [Nocardiopsis sp. CNT-189]|uniref:TetR/AcrR family transcriptional regulator n=1 Tax=Nocardiopsis oceanisediminis TaxID=2816862 RepID=UPI003B2C34CD